MDRGRGRPALAIVAATWLGIVALAGPPPPPPPAPPGVTPSAAATVTPSAAPPSSAPASSAPASSAPASSAPANGASPSAAASATPTPAVPTPVPTEPPILVTPALAQITPGGSAQIQVQQVLGNVNVTVADPALVAASVDQSTLIVTLQGKAVGSTTITISDARGLTRVVPVRVAYLAGDVGPVAAIRITGNPATQLFVKEQAMAAALAGTSARPGAQIIATADDIAFPAPLLSDRIATVSVPITIQGDAYFSVEGTTQVRVENDALPSIRPNSLLVSDFPETLNANGILFTADLQARVAERFLYYHYDPPGQPARRIVLKVQNPSPDPATVQVIDGIGGPASNELEVGHLSTERFLVHLAQNEGKVVTIPGNATLALEAQPLPPGTVVSSLFQLFEVDGAPLHLTLVAQNADDPIDGPIPHSALLVGTKDHARGIYPIPEFYYDFSYDTSGPDLAIPIGVIPLPNLVVGQTLGGDYGVLQSITVRMVNPDPRNARNIAIYAQPRGGRATGTFLIDRVLLQAHQMLPFQMYKLREYTVPPGSFVRSEIVTMPEGGSSYPVRLVVGPDDGSAAPGAPGSAIY
ncbi:MAG: hypothetical protein ACREM2_07430 [Vulcanimicrobiaceae bacterium]